MLKKILGWLFVLFIVWFVVTRPTAAAATTKWLGGGLIMVATGFGSFLSSLVS